MTWYAPNPVPHPPPDDVQLRLQCLRMSIDVHERGSPAEKIVQGAEMFRKFAKAEPPA